MVMKKKTNLNLEGLNLPISLDVESVSFATKIHNILRMAIITGGLSPGQTISEIEISRKFAISRQPVREAFILLGQERLIEAVPNRGTYVRKISVREVLDSCFVREVIELAIVKEVTEKHDAKLIRQLRRNVAQQERVKAAENKAFLELDEEFHHLLAQHAGRDFAWEVTERVKSQLNRVRFLTYDHPTPKSSLVSQHTEIVDAIESGDVLASEQKMRHHFAEIYRSLPIVAQEYPDYFAP